MVSWEPSARPSLEACLSELSAIAELHAAAAADGAGDTARLAHENLYLRRRLVRCCAMLCDAVRCRTMQQRCAVPIDGATGAVPSPDV
jgi:hypothetical protein